MPNNAYILKSGSCSEIISIQTNSTSPREAVVVREGNEAIFMGVRHCVRILFFFSLLINVVHTMFCASQPHTVIKYLLFSYCDFILDILYTCITMHVTGCCKTYPTKEEMQNSHER